MGFDNLMWGSDYPHPDSVWPDSLEIIQETVAKLGPERTKQIVRDNAVKLYRMGE